MDCTKVGRVIRALRLEKKMMQKQLAATLGVGVGEILDGELASNEPVGGNMKKTKFFVCPQCHSITLCTGEATVTCCGRKLEPLTPRKAEGEEKLSVERVENEWLITSSYPMEKENYISFVAFAAADQVQILKQYPEWNLQVRMPRRRHGTLLWYSTRLGLLYQLI